MKEILEAKEKLKTKRKPATKLPKTPLPQRPKSTRIQKALKSATMEVAGFSSAKSTLIRSYKLPDALRLPLDDLFVADSDFFTSKFALNWFRDRSKELRKPRSCMLSEEPSPQSYCQVFGSKISAFAPLPFDDKGFCFSAGNVDGEIALWSLNRSCSFRSHDATITFLKASVDGKGTFTGSPI